MPNNNNRNSYVANEELQIQVTNQMQQFKSEVASELGLINYEAIDKGELTSRQNGYVGGNMTKKMVSYAEMVISQQGAQVVSQTAPVLEIPQRIRQLNEMASRGLTPGLQVSSNQNHIQ